MINVRLRTEWQLQLMNRLLEPVELQVKEAKGREGSNKSLVPQLSHGISP